jgi:hypothetical protein
MKIGPMPFSFELPEPPNGSTSDFAAAGRKFGEWIGLKASEQVKKAIALGACTDSFVDELGRRAAADIAATVQDLGSKGWASHLPHAFEEEALASYKRFFARASAIEKLKG